MSAARHPRSADVAGLPPERILERYVARFADRKPDWYAFEDARIEGYRRAQHRFIGAGASGKHDDPDVIPAGAFTLTMMFVNPGQGNAAHTHEHEEVFYVLEGFLDVFVDDDDGRRVWTRLGRWDCISCPQGVIHGYENRGLEPTYFLVMHGRGRPQTMGYAEDALFAVRDAHLLAGSPDSSR